MPTHDFASLSSYDFQELIRDLLQAEWRTRLESFTAGPDAGIDLRAFTATRGETIIQCKHFVSGRFRDLLSHVRRSELPKIKAVAPQRYVFATSRGLELCAEVGDGMKG